MTDKEEPQNPFIFHELILMELIKVLHEKGVLTVEDLVRIRNRSIKNE